MLQRSTLWSITSPNTASGGLIAAGFSSVPGAIVPRNAAPKSTRRTAARSTAASSGKREGWTRYRGMLEPRGGRVAEEEWMTSRVMGRPRRVSSEDGVAVRREVGAPRTRFRMCTSGA